jgi:hypothetical protein
MNLEYSRHNLENFEIKNVMKIRQMRVVFHADRYDEASSHFSQLCETA